ncbi:MAG TPA: hypothetical protein VFZ69_04480 [Longimicrobiales bacterium]
MRPMSGMLLLLMLAACSGEGTQSDTAARDTLTRRQRDSIIGASRLPGARGVQRALEASDSAAARNAAMDSILR